MNYNFILGVLRITAKICFRYEVIDLRKEKTEEPYIICSNHISNWDPILVAMALPYRLYFMGKAELLKVPVVKQIMNGLEMIPVHRNENDITAIKRSLKTVREKKHFCIFPQGTRYWTPITAEQFKSGAFFIASACNSGILPVGISTKNHKLRFFAKVKIIIGDPLSYEDLGFVEDRKNYDGAAKATAEKIIELVSKGV